MKRVFKQQRGSAIGNQTSPSLANIAVSYLEHPWHEKHKDVLARYAEELYIVRYVDQHLADKWFMQEFLADFSTNVLWNLRILQMESSLAPFWTLIFEHTHLQLPPFSFAPLICWCIAAGGVILGLWLSSYETRAVCQQVSPEQALRKPPPVSTQFSRYCKCRL